MNYSNTPYIDKLEILRRGYLNDGKPFQVKHKQRELTWLMYVATHNRFEESNDALRYFNEVFQDKENTLTTWLNVFDGSDDDSREITEGETLSILKQSQRLYRGVHIKRDIKELVVYKEDVDVINKVDTTKTIKKILICLITYARAYNVVEFAPGHIMFYGRQMENRTDLYNEDKPVFDEVLKAFQSLDLVAHNVKYTEPDEYGECDEFDNYYWKYDKFPEANNQIYSSTLVYDIAKYVDGLQFTKVCECCGKEFPIAYHSRTKKCPDCYKQYRRDYKTQKQREYRK